MVEFKAAIFDLDGTILDSMHVWEKIDIDFLAKRNLPVPDEYANNISALNPQEAAKYTIKLFGFNEKAEDIIKEWNEMALYEYSNNIRLRPYVKEYLYNLKSAGVKLAVATSLTKVLYEPVLRNNDAFDMFEAICSTDEVARGKEHPDVFLLAAEKLKVSPEDCIVFEDIPQAIEACKKIGMKVYGVFDKYSEKYKEDILNTADGYIYSFKNAPYPLKK